MSRLLLLILIALLGMSKVLAQTPTQLEIKDRVRAMGAKMDDKYKTFVGLNAEMKKCGFRGNHAVTAWKWYRDGDLSKIACLESKHSEVLQAKKDEADIKSAHAQAINAMRMVDCSKKDGVNLKTMCFAIQALIK